MEKVINGSNEMSMVTAKNKEEHSLFLLLRTPVEREIFGYAMRSSALT